MTTEDLIESFMRAGRRAFVRHMARRSAAVRRLLRHEPATVDGIEMTCIQELVAVKTAEEIRRVLPDCGIEVTLDGNDSTISAELTEDEQERLNTHMYAFLERNGCIREDKWRDR